MAPRLRDDLVAATVDEQGVTCVEVTDPVTTTGFRFYDFEYALAQQLTGQPLEAVIAWADQTYELELTRETLDQFIEKLAGLGFLVGGTSGGQPAISSAEPPSGPFPGLAIAAAAEASPLPDSASPRPLAEPTGSPSEVIHEVSAGSLVSARVPERSIFGDAAKNPPKEGSGSTETARGEPRPAHDAPRELLPRLQVLAGPLPPLAEPHDGASRHGAPGGEAKSRERGRAKSDVSPPNDTPLGAIAHAIVAETSGPPPSGALDAAGSVPSAVSTGDAAGSVPSAVSTGYAASVPSAVSKGKAAGSVPSAVSAGKAVPESRDSWAAALVQEVDKPRADRRQPPRADVVVMPPVAEPSAAVRVPRRRSSIWVILLLLGGAGGAGVWFFRSASGPVELPSSPSAPSVHIVTPQPTTFYQWFETVGVVVPGRNATLAFSSAGRVQDVMPPGTTFSAGETVARLQGVVAREILANRLRARVAFAEQLRGSSLAEGNRAAAHLAEAKLAARKQELAAAQNALAEWEIHPKAAGEIAEVLVKKGDYVNANVPVFRIRAAGPRAIISLPIADATRARALPFCRVETLPGGGGADGGVAESRARAIDCSLSTATAHDEKQVAVDFVSPTSVLPGTQVRLASARYDGVFALPASAVARIGGVDTLWVVSGGGQRAEKRVVEIAATVDGLVLVAHGMAVGEAIVIDPPPGLKTGGEISIAR